MIAGKVMKARVSAKGWIVIPAALRRHYGLTQGTIVEFKEAKGKIVLVPRIPDPIEGLYGKLASKLSLTEALLDERVKELKREEADIRTG